MKPAFKTWIILILAFSCNYALAQKGDKKLHVPASKGDLAAVKRAISKGTKVDKKDIAGQTALMYAAETGNLEIVKYLVEQGANINAVSGRKGRGTPLIYAAAANKVEIVEYLLKNGGDINATTPYQNETALIWAVASGHEKIVKLLLENGADKNITNRGGENVIDIAKKLDKVYMVELLSGN